MATGVMEEYFTRLGVTKLLGVLGFALGPGQITEDQEAMDQARRLAADVRNHLGLMEKNSGNRYRQKPEHPKPSKIGQRQLQRESSDSSDDE